MQGNRECTEIANARESRMHGNRRGTDKLQIRLAFSKERGATVSAGNQPICIILLNQRGAFHQCRRNDDLSERTLAHSHHPLLQARQGLPRSHHPPQGRGISELILDLLCAVKFYAIEVEKAPHNLHGHGPAWSHHQLSAAGLVLLVAHSVVKFLEWLRVLVRRRCLERKLVKQVSEISARKASQIRVGFKV